MLRSIGVLFVQEPVLRQRTLLGACSFAMFAIFWTPLAFLLAQPPYAYSDATIGLFGLVGAAGTLAAGLAGRMSDRGQTGRATAIALLLLLLSWLPLGLSAHSLLALLVGVVVLDLAAQLLHVSNQNLIYALQPAARNRLNAGYMTGYSSAVRWVRCCLRRSTSASAGPASAWPALPWLRWPCCCGCPARCARARRRCPTRSCPAAPAPIAHRRCRGTGAWLRCPCHARWRAVPMPGSARRWH